MEIKVFQKRFMLAVVLGLGNLLLVDVLQLLVSQGLSGRTGR
jgi:hypothetical protein